MNDTECSLLTLDRDVRRRRTVARAGLPERASATTSRRERKAFDDGRPIALAYDAAYFRFASGASLLTPPPPRAFSFAELEQQESEQVPSDEFEALFAAAEPEPEEEEERDGEDEEEEGAAAAGPSLAADTQAFAQRMLERAKEQEAERAMAASDDAENAAAAPGSHRIFDDIARHMAQATTYDVGKVDVDSLFREFDRSIEKKPKKGTNARSQSQPEAVQFDRDFETDLDLIAIAASTAPAESTETAAERSGPRWVERFPAGRETASLDPSFRTNVERFTAAIADAGARLRIGSTRLPAERAYLMHWAWQIANGHDAQNVPPMQGVPIDWWHGDPATSKAAAILMADGFGIGNAPAAPPLTSRHTSGQAADIDVVWDGELTIRAADGTNRTIASSPRSENNAELIELARTYDVVRGSDAGHAAHWSHDGA